MSLREVVDEHARFRRRLALATADEAAQMWRQVDPARIAATWTSAILRLMVMLAGAQRAVAGRADDYLDAVLDAQDIDPSAEGRVDPAALAGVASDGRTLATLLYRPAVATLVGISRGSSVEQALSGGADVLDMVVRTQVADAGRAADQVAVAARPRVTGYVRMLVGRSCSRCVILAGRRYGWNAGFRRHPRCFPAGVVVDGPRSEAATRRFYQGELVVLTTASGQELPLTGNHPVLTSRGWVPANLLQKGDEVVRSTRAEGASPLVVPDHHQVPARIEDVWGSLGVPILDAMESSPQDFHGDGQHGKVDVVRADCALDNRIFAAFSEHVSQCDLSRAAGSPFSLDGQGAAILLDLADAAHAGRPVGLSYLGLPLFGGLGSGSGQPGFAHPPALHPGFGQNPGDRSSRGAVLLRESVFAGSPEVSLDNFVGRQGENLTRWDAPGDAFSVETRDGYAARGLDLLQRLAGQVEPDRLVEVRRVEWSGHVYSLTSSEGWHSANSLIVSNCDCVHVPAREDTADDVRTDPRRFFDSLSEAEQDRIFTKAGAAAIREGADVSQTVNARRGMFTATDGRQYTTEAAGRRPRLMPEQILIEADGDRAEAIRLLRLHRYLV